MTKALAVSRITTKDAGHVILHITENVSYSVVRSRSVSVVLTNPAFFAPSQVINDVLLNCHAFFDQLKCPFGVLPPKERSLKDSFK